MPHLLLPSSPIYGHLVPMLSVARALVGRGHTVTVLTGTKYRSRVEQTGATFLALPPEADYDDADLDAWLPGRAQQRGLGALRYDLLGMFVRPLRAQHEALSAALATGRYDAVVCELVFLGSVPTLDLPRDQRVPVVGVSALPLTLSSVDCAPFGTALQPGRSALSRLRNRVLNTVLHDGPFRAITAQANADLRELGAAPLPGTIFDMPLLYDRTYQLSAPSLEYPRRELPSTFTFLGPIRPEPRSGDSLPGWWADLDTDRPVVHVTQGTLDNADLDRLLVPTIRGLADEDVLVVASTGGRDVSTVVDAFAGSLPPNARVAEFLPYDRLLPEVDVVVTNGGFGGVQQSLAHGVPLVVAGATEDKPEVAARVAWSGTGIDLRTGTPSPEKVAAGVRRVLDDQRHARAARRVAAEIKGLGDPLTTLVTELETLLADRARGSVTDTAR
jgi:UDP:flavonoid glycosyltransferase YjiC (YdhE family)